MAFFLCGQQIIRRNFQFSNRSLVIKVNWHQKGIEDEWQQTYAEVMARYLSCPAVSQIWAFIVLPSTWIKKGSCIIHAPWAIKQQIKCTCMLRVANSTPMVDLDSKLNSLRVKRERRLLLPTPESPINTTRKSSYHKLDWGRWPRSSSPIDGGSVNKALDSCSL